MAYPIDPKQGFLRTPARYPHDAFGVDTGGRARPHSGFDATPTVANATACSVLGGKVIRTGYTIYAGHYVVEVAPDGWLWLSMHLAKYTVSVGDELGPGDAIGIVGRTGGGGGSPLTGNTKMGIHIHVSRCRDIAAVNRIVNGYVRARYKGETSAQWALAHGLSDPYPHIIASGSDKTSRPSNPTKNGFLMALSDKDQDEVLRRLREQEPKLDAIQLWIEASRNEQLYDNGTQSKADRLQRSVESLTGKVEEQKSKADQLHDFFFGISGDEKYSFAPHLRNTLNDIRSTSRAIAEKLGIVSK